MITTAIITAPRPRPTIAVSIASYRAAGFDGLLRVYSDGPLDVCDLGYGILGYPNTPPLGNFRNWVKAMQGICYNSQSSYLMVCEDDIVWADDAYAALLKDLEGVVNMPNAGCLSLYCPAKVSNAIEKERGKLQRGFYGAQMGKHTWGAQCLVFSREQAVWLLENEQFKSMIADPHWYKNIDMLIGRCMTDAGRDIVYRIPCLVDHKLGDGNSSLGYAADRPNLRTKYWTGRP
jgi:hypothetical protein